MLLWGFFRWGEFFLDEQPLHQVLKQHRQVNIWRNCFAMKPLNFHCCKWNFDENLEPINQNLWTFGFSWFYLLQNCYVLWQHLSYRSSSLHWNKSIHMENVWWVIRQNSLKAQRLPFVGVLRSHCRLEYGSSMLKKLAAWKWLVFITYQKSFARKWLDLNTARTPHKSNKLKSDSCRITGRWRGFWLPKKIRGNYTMRFLMRNDMGNNVY